jgi:hypothetical protein
MKKVCFLIFLFLAKFSSAQYVAGGEIKYACVGVNQYQFTISIWGDNLNSSDTLFLDFGDNTTAVLTQPTLLSLASSLPSNYSNYYQAGWQIIHAFSGSGSYKISAVYKTRRSGIDNIPNSPGTVFYLACDVEIDPNIGCNSSPVFSNAQYILFTPVNQPFSFSPSVSDPDGDSLSFSVEPCDVIGYTLPNMIGMGVFSIDATTGEIDWNAPQVAGIYNFVLRVTQWKHVGNGIIVTGSTDQELEIDVQSPSGIPGNNSSSFSIYPQPAGDFIFIKTDAYDLSYEIMNVSGQIISEGISSGRISTAEISDGIYFLRLTDETGISSSRKFIVQH